MVRRPVGASDQFFDEGQWESYRCLGEHISTNLFQRAEAGTWSPRAEMLGATTDAEILMGPSSQ